MSNQGSHHAAGDFDEDGIPDVVVVQPPADGSPARVDLMRGNGNTATFARTLGTLNLEVTSMGQGDAGGDAEFDLLVRVAGGRFYLIRDTAQRSWHNYGAQTAIVGGRSGIAHIASGDGNNDGIDDLYTLRPGASCVDQFLGNGSSFQAPVFKNLSGAASDFVKADFNRDERLDFAYVVPDENEIRLIQQNFSGYFGWADSTVASYAGAASYSKFWLEQDFFTVRVVHPDGPTGKSFSRTYGASNTVRISLALFSNSFE